jgi:hypothetical protein
MKINDLILVESKKIKESGFGINDGFADALPGIKVVSLPQFVGKDDPESEVAEDMYEEDEELDEALKLNAPARTMSEPEMTAYLDRVVDKKKLKTDKYKNPYVHGGNVPIIDSDTGRKFDLEKLKQEIKTRPKQLLKQNEKMVHSDGTSSIFFNIGLPALKGLAVDEETNQFVVVDTCPGAGACQIYCYAMKGGYVQWKASSMSQTRVLNFLLNDPEGFKKMLDTEINKAEKKYTKKDTRVIVRWHDAGDFFSPEYLNLAYALAKDHPDVNFYAYTKIADVASGAKPKNFRINFSGGAKPSQERKIDFQKVKHSKVVPKDMFKDSIAKNDQGRWVWNSQQDLNNFKNELGRKYNVNPRTILTYDEMMATPESDQVKYNVIVMPGDGDDSANRPDVLGTYLLFH